MRNGFRVTDDLQSRAKKVVAVAFATMGVKVLALHGIRNGACTCPKGSSCPSAGKHPLGALFRHGHKDASDHPVKIADALDGLSGYNIGVVPTGDLLVVDIDGPDGEAAVAKFDLPPTVTVKTGRGRHLYFFCDGLDGWRAPNINGVDFRYCGNGYVVAPPSRHVSDFRYTWVGDIKKPATISLDLFKQPTVRVDFTDTRGSSISSGSRNTRLTSVGGLLRKLGHSREAVESTLLAINKVECKPPLDEDEVRRIARSVARYEPEIAQAFGNLDDVEPEEPRWLLAPYIPLGVVSVLEGDPGLGKSNVTMAIAAAISSGSGVPWSNDRPQGRVLILSAEDDPARIIKPRLIANGADFSNERLRFAREPFSLDDQGLQLLQHEIEQFNPTLVIIDPIVAWMGAGVDAHKSTDMTLFFKGLYMIARRHDCAILVVRHLRKSRQGDALMQGHGSIAIVGSVRSALALGRHPGDRDLRVIAHSKTNYGEFGPSILFSLENRSGTPAIEWRGTDASLTAEDLMSPPVQEGPGRPAQASGRAKTFVLEFISEEPTAWEAVLRAAEARAIASKATLDNVRTELAASGEIVQVGKGKLTRWVRKRPSVHST